MIMLLHLTRVDDGMCFKHISFLFLVQKKSLEVNMGEKWNLLSIIVNIGKSCQYCLNDNINDSLFIKWDKQEWVFSHWHCLLKLKRKKNPFKIIIGFFFTLPLFLAIKVAILFVYYLPKTIKCTQKPKIKKKVYRNRTSKRVPFSTSYLQLALAHAHNSQVKKELEKGVNQ